MAAGDLLVRDGQIEWRGVLLGAGTPYKLKELSGWSDLPGMRGGSTDLTGYHGALAGQLHAESRRIVAELLLPASIPLELFPAATTELRRITAPAEQPAEEPLVIRLDGQRRQVLARVTKRALPTTREYALGWTAPSIEWEASDPRLHWLPQQTGSTPLATSSSTGLVFPLVFPLVFGTGPTGGSMTLPNSGNATAWPRFRLTGPLTGPTLSDLDTGARLRFDPTWTLPAGQQVDIHTRPGARGASFVGSGVSVSGRLFDRQWLSIPAGGQLRLGFSSLTYDAAASCLATWHHTDL
ncbi:phage tail family protein [Crossiella sp. SN42]|uniref:phage tail family protein n=1 Tax=Crossiella sp. SN42 TaxID=2944808 RepID=UPI00207C1490|nr:phage tail family protein [Crossiella sp. SN42]MCO1575034.1 phage tail family protein [Crossiella sp. SN42]